MKTKTIVLAVALTLAAMSATAQKYLTVLHTNDTHSCVLPLSAQLADTMLAGRGGFARRVAMLERERKADKDLLLFDSGDFSQGSSFYTLFKGDVEVGLMNMMRYDAGTLGNHEFDFGLKNLARVVGKLNYPVVCANYKFSQYGLDRLVKPYVIIKRKGLRIGVFGLGTKLDGMVDRKNYERTVYLDPVATAQKMADTLRKKKCDLVICVTHLGWITDGVGDQEVIARTRGIDLVLGGHSHTYFKALRYVKNLDGKPIPVDQNGKHGIFIGKMRVRMDRKR